MRCGDHSVQTPVHAGDPGHQHTVQAQIQQHSKHCRKEQSIGIKLWLEWRRIGQAQSQEIVKLLAGRKKQEYLVV